MRIGWRQLVKNMMAKPSAYHSVGIEFSAEELHISVFKQENKQAVWVLQHHLKAENWVKELKTWVAEHQLQHTATHVALSIEKYKILQVDKPGVADEELAQALRWSIKDLLPTQDEVVLDYFDLPAQTMGANKVNVIAIPKVEAAEIISGLQKAGLTLDSIGVEELATCDLYPRTDEAIMHVTQGVGREVCLNIIKNGKLYFSRRLKGYEKLSTFSEEELRMGMGDNLSIEIQRSMDYFEGQLRQAGVKKILLAMDTPYQQVLAELVKQLTLLDVEPFAPDLNKVEGLEVNANNLTSLGAALSKELVDEGAAA